MVARMESLSIISSIRSNAEIVDDVASELYPSLYVGLYEKKILFLYLVIKESFSGASIEMR